MKWNVMDLSQFMSHSFCRFDRIVCIPFQPIHWAKPILWRIYMFELICVFFIHFVYLAICFCPFFCPSVDVQLSILFCIPERVFISSIYFMYILIISWISHSQQENNNIFYDFFFSHQLVMCRYFPYKESLVNQMKK